MKMPHLIYVAQSLNVLILFNELMDPVLIPVHMYLRADNRKADIYVDLLGRQDLML
jgi:hypothetical protein